MAKAAPTLDRLPLVDKEAGDFTVVLETPKGSRNKYRYDAKCQAIRLSATLGEGLAFPYDFGFFPSTRGEDGDPLDVLLFLDDAVPPGSVATARLIGVLEVEQKDQGEPWERNDRFFAVATHAHAHQAL
ncbi:MAG TPA: inorganic diphosphatase, partial [Reyranella sp.]|nr:inorganic diphosphatase [Reyranella sp.]